MTHSPAVETLSVDALWITDQSQPERLIYGMLKALYNPANRPALQSVRAGVPFHRSAIWPEADARAACIREPRAISARPDCSKPNKRRRPRGRCGSPSVRRGGRIPRAEIAFDNFFTPSGALKRRSDFG